MLSELSAILAHIQLTTRPLSKLSKVEPHEAEWRLETIEDLFEHFYVGRRRRKLGRVLIKHAV
jgi:hypothetical protein